MNSVKTRYRILIPSCLMLSALLASLICIFVLYLVGRPTSYVWVMDRGEFKNETSLVKMCPTVERLVEVQFGQSGEIGIDPTTHIVWAPEGGDVDEIHYDELVQIDQNGRVLDRFHGYSSPVLAIDFNDGSVWLSTWSGIAQQALSTNIAPNGKLIRRISGFYLPSAIAVDPRDSSIWVADGGNRNLTHLSKDGEILFQMSISGYFFSNAPDQVAVEPLSGNVWFTTAAGMIYKLSADGNVLFERGGLSRPIAVTISPINGDVWVADYDLGGSGGLVKLDSEGHLLLTQALPSHAHTAAVNPFDGVLWVGVDGQILRYDNTGELIGTETDFNEPESIAFAESRNNLLTEIKCTFDSYDERLK